MEECHQVGGKETGGRLEPLVRLEDGLLAGLRREGGREGREEG